MHLNRISFRVNSKEFFRSLFLAFIFFSSFVKPEIVLYDYTFLACSVRIPRGKYYNQAIVTYTSLATDLLLFARIKSRFSLLLVPLETTPSVENAHFKNSFLISKQ